MSETSSTKARSQPSMTSQAAFRKVPRRNNVQPKLVPLSMGARALTSDSSSVITTSTAMRHLQVRTNCQNTYKMEPDEDKRFTPSTAVRDTIREIMESRLADIEYDNDKCSDLSQELSRLVKQRIQEMKHERYKLVVTIMIGENTGQSLQIASQFLWNTHTDNFVTAEYRNGTLFAVATIYAVYFD